jgi:hypothetical protein
MARHIEEQLYSSLIDAKFRFMARGEHHIDDIYARVKTEFPLLCDDQYFCSENCNAGNNQSEWKHTVRNALQRLKKLDQNIAFTGKRGYWSFG